MVKYKLNDWSVVTNGDPYLAPEVRRILLMGKVEGHPDREDGETIITSHILGKYDGRLVTNSGSLVELGAPQANYAESYPDAAQRLLDTAPQCVLLPDGSIR